MNDISEALICILGCLTISVYWILFLLPSQLYVLQTQPAFTNMEMKVAVSNKFLSLRSNNASIR